MSPWSTGTSEWVAHPPNTLTCDEPCNKNSSPFIWWKYLHLFYENISIYLMKISPFIWRKYLNLFDENEYLICILYISIQKRRMFLDLVTYFRLVLQFNLIMQTKSHKSEGHTYFYYTNSLTNFDCPNNLQFLFITKARALDHVTVEVSRSHTFKHTYTSRRISLKESVTTTHK
jgi:hypothetical protein